LAKHIDTTNVILLIGNTCCVSNLHKLSSYFKNNPIKLDIIPIIYIRFSHWYSLQSLYFQKYGYTFVWRIEKWLRLSIINIIGSEIT